MIGSVQELDDASKGNFAPKTRRASSSTTPPVDTSPTNAYADALTRKAMYAPSASLIRSSALPQQVVGVASGGLQGDINASAKAVVPGSQIPATKLYANILASGQRSPLGLSGKGKYGGFYNAGDLETAIRGSAIGIRSLAPQLRSEAASYYGNLDTAFEAAKRQPTEYYTARGYASQLAQLDPYRGYRADLPGGEIVNPAKQYVRSLRNWYGEASKPAEEYLQTAQQLEATPLSQLAQRIAVSQYGMNPNLASGKFSGLDAEYFKQQRDEEYISQYGVPYEQWAAEQTKAQKDYAALTKSQQDQIKSTVEQGTGFSSSRLQASTNMTPAQMQAAMSTAYDYNGQQLTGQDLINQVNSYVSQGQIDMAKSMLDDLKSDSTTQGIYRLINVLLNFSVAKPSNITDTLP